MEKKIWRKNFEIQRTHFQMGAPAIFDMVNLHHITVGKRCVNEVVWIQEGYDNVGTYFPKSQLRDLIDKTLEVFIDNPKKIDRIHDKCVQYNKELFNYAKEIYRKDLKKLSVSELEVIWKKWINLLINSHGHALPTTWFVDSDGEDLSRYLISECDKLITKSNSKLNSAEVFGILTTPLKKSFAYTEELESLKILKEIKEDVKTRKLFIKHGADKLVNKLEEVNPKIKSKIMKHFNKWRWAPYTYIGPAYDLDYYLSLWSGHLRESLDIDKKIYELENFYKNAAKKKQEIVKELEIDSKTKHLFDIASDIIFLKAFRKDCWFYGCYVVEKIYKEIGRRLGLSLNQVWFMGFWEVIPALKNNKFDHAIINERIKFSVLYVKDKKCVIYAGDKARGFIKNINFEKIKKIKTDKLEGTCAFSGKTKGIVKIVNLPEDMSKMEKGNIMVSHTTYPSLVPAMKKASAIITDDGGITCHAAIVARELKITCIVGTKIATKVLKDGDLVEVDANDGSVKKVYN